MMRLRAPGDSFKIEELMLSVALGSSVGVGRSEADKLVGD